MEIFAEFEVSRVIEAPAYDDLFDIDFVSDIFQPVDDFLSRVVGMIPPAERNLYDEPRFLFGRFSRARRQEGKKQGNDPEVFHNRCNGIVHLQN